MFQKDHSRIVQGTGVGSRRAIATGLRGSVEVRDVQQWVNYGEREGKMASSGKNHEFSFILVLSKEMF